MRRKLSSVQRQLYENHKYTINRRDKSTNQILLCEKLGLLIEQCSTPECTIVFILQRSADETVLSGRTVLKHGSAVSGLPQWLSKSGFRGTVEQSYAHRWTTVFVPVYQRGIPSSHSATLGGATPSFSLLVLDARAKQSADKPAGG